MRGLILRFDAPLIAFGGPAVDRRRVVDPMPGVSMVTGLLANAMGWEHADWERTSALQARLRIASRADRRGEPLRDYHTVDLGHPHLAQKGWTTSGVAEGRDGGKASSGTHVKLSDYWADAVHTVVIALDPPDASPDLEEIAAALLTPARPLFIGRKCCLPSGPILVGAVDGPTLHDVLASVKRAPRAESGPLAAWWPASSEEPGRTLQVTDHRDWANQIHVGRRTLNHGRVDPPRAVTRG